MVRRRARSAVLLLALLGPALVACTDDPTPQIADPTPTASTSAPEPTTSTSPSPAPLTPEETVRAWFTAWSLALVSGDTVMVRELSSVRCASCIRLVKKVESVYDRGARYDTDGWRTRRLTPAPEQSDSPIYVMQVVQGERTLLDASGQVVDVAAAQRVPMRMTLEKVDAQWVVANLEILT